MDGKRRRKTGGPRARLITYAGRPLGIRWRLGDKTGEISSGTTDRDEAIGAKALLLRDLENGILPGKEIEGPAITCPDFRLRYQTEHLVSLSEGSYSAWTTSANHLERLLHPRHLVDVDKGKLSRFRGLLLEDGLSPNSVATYVRTIRAAIGWAYDMDLIADLPKIRARKGLKKRSGMRSRPITAEEFDRILATVVKVRPKDAAAWERFLRGLWHSSLRVDELRRLSWNEQADLSIDTAGRYPMIRMLAEGHKSRRDCYQPITPEFWEVISQRGYVRAGYVFPLPARKTDQMSRNRVIRVIGEIGAKAGVITDPATGKTATSHDIGRRAALTRLSKTLTMSQTQQWARHSDPRTTSQYYIRDEAESLAEAAGWGVAK